MDYKMVWLWLDGHTIFDIIEINLEYVKGDERMSGLNGLPADRVVEILSEMAW